MKSRSDVKESVLFTQERRILMDWVNSLDVDSCMLASGVEDLRFGMVLCDVAAHVTERHTLQEVRRGYVGHDTNKQDALHNLSLFVREFQRQLPEPLRLSADELYTNDDALFQILRFWAGHKDPTFVSGFLPETRPKRQSGELQSPTVSPRIAADTHPVVKEAPPRRLPPAAKTPRKSEPENPTPRKVSMAEEHAVTPPVENRPLVRPVITPAKRPQTADPPRQVTAGVDGRGRQSLGTAEETPLAPPRQSGSEIPPVSELTKDHLFTWLQSLSLVRRTVKIEELPSLSSTGVLLCDLLNRLEGRSDVVKGVDRNPKNRTSIQANFTKALTYLRSFDKMNSRYLWASGDLMAGVEDVFWGLLDDVKSLFKSKAVSLDAHMSPAPNQRSRSLSKGKSVSVTPSGAISSRFDTIPTSPKSFRLQRTPNTRIPQSDDSVEYPRQPSSTHSSALVKGIGVEFQPLEVTGEMETEIKAWVAGLKLSHLLGHDNKHYLVDPFKNGVLLCELVSVLEKNRIPNVDKTPANVQAVRENVEKALCLLRDRKPSVPLVLLRQGEKITQGNTKATWNLLWALKAAYPDSNKELMEAPEPGADLPYSSVALKRLEMSLVSWMYSLGVTGKVANPVDLNDVLPDIRSGVMLCDLVAKVLPINIPGVTRGPKSDAVAAANVRRALEPLRKNNRMSQLFVWREKEICMGETQVVLGLLEDLHRYSDGLQARKRGPDYFKDGPYLGRQYTFKPRPTALQSRPSDTSKALEMARKQASLPSPPLPLQVESESSPMNRFRLNRMDQFVAPPCSSLTKVTSPRPALQHFKQHSDQSSFDFSRQMELTDERLFLWLDNVGVRYPAGTSVEKPEGFRNGALMCQIVEVLTKTQLRGYTPYPKTTAAALNNIRKFLEYMRTLPGFPSRLFFVEEDVMRGDRDTIRELLQEVYRCFRSSIRNSIRIKERVMKRVNSESSFRSRHNYSIS